HSHDAAGVLEIVARARKNDRSFSRSQPPCSAAHLRHPSARRWRRPAQRANHAGPCRHRHHPNLYARATLAPPPDRGSPSSPRRAKTGLYIPGANNAMSDYMFMLDSHLTGEQTRALTSIRDAAETAGFNLFLTG